MSASIVARSGPSSFSCPTAQHSHSLPPIDQKIIIIFVEEMVFVELVVRCDPTDFWSPSTVLPIPWFVGRSIEIVEFRDWPTFGTCTANTVPYTWHNKSNLLDHAWGKPQRWHEWAAPKQSP